MRRTRAAFDAERAIVEGRAVDALLAVAAVRKASLIVIGTHGRRGFARLFVGSTTEGVLRATEIPLLVVRAHYDPCLSGNWMNKSKANA